MSWLFLTPHSPLLFRDARSWDGPGAGSSVPWPTPHQFLGALRTVVGKKLGFDWNFSAPPELITKLIGSPNAPGQLSVEGPFFAQRKGTGDLELLFPRPFDLVAFPDVGTQVLGQTSRWEYPLRPNSLEAISVDSPSGMDTPLLPLCHRPPETGQKPLPGNDLPQFLSADQFDTLLFHAGAAPLSQGGKDSGDPPQPARERRNHVTISADTGTGEDGLLFSTERLVLPSGWQAGIEEYGFALRILPESLPVSLEGPWRIGGKGGSVEATALLEASGGLDSRKANAVSRLKGAEHFRWVLTTPARFSRGWIPGWLDTRGEGTFPGTEVRVRLVAAAVDRPLFYSGWDLQYRGEEADPRLAGGGPRPSRALVRPGAVYFFENLKPSKGDGAAIASASWQKSLFPFEPIPECDPTWALDRACGLNCGVFGSFEPFSH